MTQKQLAQNLDSLKASFDSNLNRVVQSVKSSNEAFDAKINTLNQHVAGVKDEIVALKSLLKEETKQKTLERALSLTDIDSFEYYPSRSYQKSNSGELVKKAIKWFMLGSGMILSSDYCMKQNVYGNEATTSNEDFRAKFIEQIKTLIKREPRVEKRSNGNFAIYYS
eukprot:scaffold14831_cov79-Skeletonema_marinoi.AAC.2